MEVHEHSDAIIVREKMAEIDTLPICCLRLMFYRADRLGWNELAMVRARFMAARVPTNALCAPTVSGSENLDRFFVSCRKFIADP